MKTDPHENTPPVVTPQEARSGVISGRVVTILVVSMLLALLCISAVTFFWTASH
jgi:hypothetical protein